MEELQDFKLDDLYDKLRLEEDEFQAWLSEIGLLHASSTCACGNPMRKNRDGHGILHWRCFRAVYRPAAPTDSETWFSTTFAALYPCQR
uniref:Uncharacterized protein n=1 Tax=Acrobeloides nanus TaxID=290746 RepID=A0A914E1S3_9BILA